MHGSKADATALLSRVRRIELKAKGLSQQLFSGQGHSTFRGRGMSFSEVRGYQIGDDTRDIDWNVTARYASPYVKLFEEERELSLMLLIDMSSSTTFGTRGQREQDLLAELVATIAFSAIQNQDKIGAIFFTDRVERFIPARSGRKHLLYLIREVLSFEPKRDRGSDLSVPLVYLNQVVKRRCTAFLLSDFLHTAPEGYQAAMSIAARTHDLLAIRVYDEGQEYLPRLGLVQFIDPESGKRCWVDSSSKRVRSVYAERYRVWAEECRRLCSKAGVDFLELRTNQDFVPQLAQLFRRRH